MVMPRGAVRTPRHALLARPVRARPHAILNWKNVSPMSSATSTDHAAAAAFRPWHFFVILTLIAATAAVLTARKTSPENLVMLSLTVFAAGAASIAMYRTLLPLVGRERTLRADTLGHRAQVALEREKTLVLRSIKDLEFDRAMGKLADVDFEDMSERLRARALGLMRQLDASHAAPRERIERELADRLSRDAQRRPSRGAGSARPRPASQGETIARGAGAGTEGRVSAAPLADEDDEVERTETSPPDAILCEACEASNDADARFCKACGTKLARAHA
jgi:hypothetical protein